MALSARTLHDFWSQGSLLCTRLQDPIQNGMAGRIYLTVIGRVESSVGDPRVGQRCHWA